MGATAVLSRRVSRGGQAGHPSSAPDCFCDVQAVAFDLGDVLYDATVWRRWLVRLLASLGLRVQYTEFFRVWDRDYLPEVYCGRREYHEAFEAMLGSCGLSSAQIDELAAASHARRRELARHRRLLPGVRRTLGQLHAAGLPLVLLCDVDCPAEHVRDDLHRMAIANYFGAIISSYDIGHTKPDPTCFLAATAALNLPGHAVAFVGHDTRELAAASSLGMPSVAFNYDRDARADFYCWQFSELLEVLSLAHLQSQCDRAGSETT